MIGNIDGAVKPGISDDGLTKAMSGPGMPDRGVAASGKHPTVLSGWPLTEALRALADPR